MMEEASQGSSLSELARCLTVQEGASEDSLLLASAWQRLPPGSPNRLFSLIAAGLVGLLLCMLLLQAWLSGQTWSMVFALSCSLAALLGLWRIRYWFWRTRVVLDDQRLRLSYLGWGVPRSRELPLDAVVELVYRLRQGKLNKLALMHGDEAVQLPFSGQRELDKLYCNLLRHLLQKRRPAIGFRQVD